MHEQAIAAAFLAATRAHPAAANLAALQWRTTESSEPMVLPVVLFGAREAQPIEARGLAWTCQVFARVETQVDDDTEETHIARGMLLAAALTDTQGICAAINAATPRLVRAYGYAVMGSTRGVQDRHWISVLTLRVGFGVVLAL